MVNQTNRLIESTSPYLLQHSHNPVDWYPWSQEALDLSKKKNIPILLSIGYSACHWCHVMERESFENETTANIMNSNFINIKVDREERPDIDESYMAATQAMNKGQGGWPMTVFLTPDLKPFFAGTYFPPEDAYGRPGFPTLLLRISELWKEKNTDLLSQADAIVQHLNSSINQTTVIDNEITDKALNHWKASHDNSWGGFGPAPKFPNSGAITHLLYDYLFNNDKDSLNPAIKTLDSMYEGGIFDHIGGGFARYSVDEKWLVPHFEKMLYDNAQLMESYLIGYQITSKPEYLNVINKIFEWLNDEMIDDAGGLYSSMDADSEGIEGKYYVWTQSEIREILSKKDADIFCQYYDITDGGNWEGNSIPHLILEMNSLCNLLKISRQELESSIEKSRLILKKHRKSRIAPGTDDKIIVSWNGLMISSLAKVSSALDNSRFFSVASRAVSFILEKMSKKDGSLYRTHRNGISHIDAFAEDYAFFGNSLVDMYESSFDPSYLKEAKKFADILIDNFYENGIFKQSLSKNIVINIKNGMDNATPSFIFMSCLFLSRLSYYYDIQKYRNIVKETLENFGHSINDYPYAHSTALLVHNFLSKGPIEIAIAGDKPDGKLVKIFRTYLLPYKIMALSDKDLDIPLLSEKLKIDNKETSYICHNYSCDRPINSSKELDKVLSNIFKKSY